MPNNVEPTLEEMSAYVDGELDDAARATFEQHLTTCAECRTKLAGLQETAHAIRALPLESPPRSFSIPKQHVRSWSWAPVGWLGAAAAAVLVIAVGLHQLAPGGTTPTSSTATGGLAFAPAQSSSKSTSSAGSVPAAVSQGSQAFDRTAFPNGSTSIGSPNQSQRLVLGSDATSYRLNGSLHVRLILQGSPTRSTDSNTQGLTLRLMRGGVGVALSAPTGIESYDGTPVFAAQYNIQSLNLPNPPDGDYQLVATWVIADGSGRVLQASIPIKLTN